MAPTALIVDDNTSLAYFSAWNIEHEIDGVNVFTAGSCAEARALAHENQPSVCIVDLKLPDGDGLEFIGELKKDFTEIAAILVTATPLSAGSVSGLFGLLVKPYDIEELIRLVQEALFRKHSANGQGTGDHHYPELELSEAQQDFHHVQNRLSGLLAGIRALRLELHAEANDPLQVVKIVDEYTERLTAMVKDAAETLKRKV